MRIGAYTQTVYEGYEIATAFGAGDREPKAKLIVCTKPQSVAEATSRSYVPQNDPAFFLQLMAVDDLEDGPLLNAVRSYGFLKAAWDRKEVRLAGQVGNGYALVDEPFSEDWGSLLGAEAVADWQDELTFLRDTWTLWLACLYQDATTLAERIAWHRNGNRDVAEYIGQLTPTDKRTTRCPEDFAKGDLVGPAMWFVRDWAGAGLVNVSADASGGQGTLDLELQLTPTSLLGAAWLQMGQAMEKKLEFRRCEECGKWFEVKPKAPHQEFCSGACRMREYRRSKKEDDQ